MISNSTFQPGRIDVDNLEVQQQAPSPERPSQEKRFKS